VGCLNLIWSAPRPTGRGLTFKSAALWIFFEYRLPAIAESKAPPSVADELLDLGAAHSKSN
jgi:hypothetical protein